jgi:hypothetical protein
MRWLLALMFAGSMQAECITPNLRARSFFHGATNVVRAVGVSEVSVRVTSVIRGPAKMGDLIGVLPGECRPAPVAGSEYVLSQFCGRYGCSWIWFDVSRFVGMDDYFRDRHMVTRKEVTEKLAAWRHHRIDSKTLRHWIDTSDFDDDDVKSAPESLTSEALDRVRFLLDLFDAAQTCDPAAARGIREDIAGRLLDFLAEFPKQEKESEYDAWLDAHEGEADRWDANALMHFADRVEKEPEWIRANRCLDR